MHIIANSTPRGCKCDYKTKLCELIIINRKYGDNSATVNFPVVKLQVLAPQKLGCTFIFAGVGNLAETL